MLVAKHKITGDTAIANDSLDFATPPQRSQAVELFKQSAIRILACKEEDLDIKYYPQKSKNII